MYFKKGKVQFGFKDTWHLDEQLSKVICAGVQKYKDVINENTNRKGVPASISQHLVDLGVISYKEDYVLSDEDYKKCEDYFDYILDEILYAFGDNAPKIGDYNFTYKFIENDTQPDSNMIAGDLECTNESEKKRYSQAVIKHNKRCEEGRLHFAKHFHALWW